MDSLKAALKICAVVILCTITVVVASAQQLLKAVSHNDYLQLHPLTDALEEGYVNIEADIFLHKQELVVAHWFPYVKDNATLENLYLIPLAAHIRKLQTSGKADQQTITLLIDIKSNPESTYHALKILLNKYRWILSSYHNDRYLPGPVSIVLTGRKPDALISRENTRLVMMDDFLHAPSKISGSNLFAMASCKYSWVIKSKDTLTEHEKIKLRNFS